MQRAVYLIMGCFLCILVSFKERLLHEYYDNFQKEWWIMRYQKTELQNFNLGQYREQNQNTFIMLVTGSCNWEERKGSFRTALMYNQYAKVYKGDIDETTSANYCMLQGIKETLKRINYKNAKICIVVATALGFKSATKKKSINKEHIKEILDKIREKDNELEVIELQCGAEYIKSWLNRFEIQFGFQDLNEK